MRQWRHCPPTRAIAARTSLDPNWDQSRCELGPRNRNQKDAALGSTPSFWLNRGPSTPHSFCRPSTPPMPPCRCAACAAPPYARLSVPRSPAAAPRHDNQRRGNQDRTIGPSRAEFNGSHAEHTETESCERVEAGSSVLPAYVRTLTRAWGGCFARAMWASHVCLSACTLSDCADSCCVLADLGCPYRVHPEWTSKPSRQ